MSARDPAPAGAVCEDCGQNMLLAKSCTVDEIEADDGTVYRRIPYGREAEGYGFPLPDRCHDCGVAHGGYHHMGCDMELCPHCGGQLICCDFDPATRVDDPLAAVIARQHRHVRIQHGAVEAWVDEGMAPLILSCWRLGIPTEQSCQDDGGRAYVQFPDGSAAARFLREVCDVRDLDLRARALHWPATTPRKKELDRALDAAGWRAWWEQAWGYETAVRAQQVVGGTQHGDLSIATERRPHVAFPVTVRMPVADIAAVTRQLQKAARSKGRARPGAQPRRSHHSPPGD